MTSAVRAPIELRVDQGDDLETAATVFLPDPLPEHPVVVFAFPGGGLTRHMYDVVLDGHRGYSEAEYFAQHGVVFVACDHIGAGDSTPLPEVPTTWAIASAANQCTTSAAIARMRNGDLADDVASFVPALCVGMGHSMGGMLLIHQQGEYRTFDAVAIVGASAIQTTVPEVPEGGGSPLGDIPPTLGPAVAGLATTVILSPVEMLSNGPVADQAAAITVPVLVAVGESDVVPNLRAEAGAYVASPHVTLTVVPRMTHTYFVAETRRMMWDRKRAWITSLQGVVSNAAKAGP
jgi:alpha-beta hydrolase superfamily lysophospholipase